MTAYMPKQSIDWEEIYNQMEPEDQAVIDAWVKKLSAYATAHGGAGDAIMINGMGEKSARELCVKLSRFVVLSDPVCRGKHGRD